MEKMQLNYQSKLNNSTNFILTGTKLSFLDTSRNVHLTSTSSNIILVNLIIINCRLLYASKNNNKICMANIFSLRERSILCTQKSYLTLLLIIITTRLS